MRVDCKCIHDNFKFLGFKISKGSGNPQFVQSDIAVIKVNDNGKPMSLLMPACLPKPNQNSTRAVHAGWSEPPPFDFILSNASPYAPYYRLGTDINR